jgi:hypothetical protein
MSPTSVQTAPGGSPLAARSPRSTTKKTRGPSAESRVTFMAHSTIWQVIGSGIILYSGPDSDVAFSTYNLRYPVARRLGGRVDLLLDRQIVASSDPDTDRLAVKRLLLLHDARTHVQHP